MTPPNNKTYLPTRRKDTHLRSYLQWLPFLIHIGEGTVRGLADKHGTTPQHVYGLINEVLKGGQS